MPSKIVNRAFVIRSKGGFRAQIENYVLPTDLLQGTLLVKVSYSSINYKDALMATNSAKIARRSPIVGGIDLAGTVVKSNSPYFVPGDDVLAIGSGLGETLDGGYCNYCVIPDSIAISLSHALDKRSCMIIGTGGFTAALAYHCMKLNGLSPAAELPVVVTGASGGVGSFAVHLLACKGIKVTASTRKKDVSDYFKRLGASQVIGPVEEVHALLAKPIWGGAVDNLGGSTLSTLLKCIANGCSVASIGLVAGNTFDASVYPFILRGVRLLGITSANVSIHLKRDIWGKITKKGYFPSLDSICYREIALTEVGDYFEEVLQGKHLGRFIVNCS